MRKGSLLTHSVAASSQPTNPNEAKIHWLQQALPEFGLVQLADDRDIQGLASSLLTRTEFPIVLWDSMDSYPSVEVCLADALSLSSSEPVFLQAQLRRWAEEGNALWLVVDGNTIPAEALLSLLKYRPTSKTGQFAVRVLLSITDEQLKQASLSGLRLFVHERIGSSKQTVRASHAYLVYPLVAVVAFLSVGYLLLSDTLMELSAVKAPDSVIEEAAVAAVVNHPLAQRIERVAQETAQNEKRALLQVNEQEETPKIEFAVIEAQVGLWSQAWQNRDMNTYISAYSTNYSALSHMSAQEWRQWRVERIAKPKWISIEMGPVSLSALSEREVRAVFWQLYRSPSYQDDTFKELIFEKSESGWKITSETSLEVRPLP